MAEEWSRKPLRPQRFQVPAGPRRKRTHGHGDLAHLKLRLWWQTDRTWREIFRPGVAFGARALPPYDVARQMRQTGRQGLRPGRAVAQMSRAPLNLFQRP